MLSYSHMRLLLKADTAAALKRTRAMIRACMFNQTMVNLLTLWLRCTKAR